MHLPEGRSWSWSGSRLLLQKKKRQNEMGKPETKAVQHIMDRACICLKALPTKTHVIVSHMHSNHAVITVC